MRTDYPESRDRRSRIFVLLICLLVSFDNHLSATQLTDGASLSTNLHNCLDESAKELLARSDFKAAVEHLQQLLQHDRDCPDAQYMFAYSLMRENQPEESLHVYTSAARMRTPTSVDLRNVALDYVLLDDYDDARHWIKAALSMDPKDAENWYVLGRIQYSTSHAVDAANSFQKAIELEPRSIKAENNLGLAYEALNEPEKATEAYRRAIQFGEESGKPSEQPLLNLAILLSHEGYQQRALGLLMTAVTIAPEDADVLEHLGHLYMSLNELPEARLYLEKAAALHPSDARLHFLLGQLYRRSGMTEKSKAELALAASLEATHSTPLHGK